MIDTQELDRTILELEQRDTTYATCERLAWLYIVRDHTVGTHIKDVINGTGGTSDFMRAIEGKERSAVFNIIDELMTALQVTNPRAYNAVMAKIGRI